MTKTTVKSIVVLFVMLALVTIWRDWLGSDDDIEDLPNFYQVSSALYRGGQPSQTGFKKLKEMGVKTVVSLRVSVPDRHRLRGVGMQYYQISFKPWHAEAEDILPFLKIVTNPENQPVFVHCFHGSDRTGTMVALYQMVVHGYTARQSIEELPHFGFHKLWLNLPRYLNRVDVADLRRQMENSPQPALEYIQ